MSLDAITWAIENNRVKSLPPTPRHLLLVLANRANVRTAECFMAQSTMADETGLSSTAITTALRELKDQGFVEWTGEYRMKCKVLRLNLEDEEVTLPFAGKVADSTWPRPCRDVAATLPPPGNKPEPQPEPTEDVRAVNVPTQLASEERIALAQVREQIAAGETACICSLSPSNLTEKNGVHRCAVCGGLDIGQMESALEIVGEP